MLAQPPTPQRMLYQGDTPDGRHIYLEMDGTGITRAKVHVESQEVEVPRDITPFAYAVGLVNGRIQPPPIPVDEEVETKSPR